MFVLTDCIADKTDEGCLKVANSLVRRLRELSPDTMVVSYGDRFGQNESNLKLNKLFLNRKLFRLLNSREDRVLYIPFSSNTKASILRTWILSHFCKNGIDVLFVLRHPMKRVFQKLLQRSGARIITLSKASHTFFQDNLKNEVIYLKTGVDIQKFRPVKETEKAALRRKYGFGEEETVVLHVGHLKAGRNVGKLLQIDPKYRVVLVASTASRAESDEQLRSALESKRNITVFDTYMDKIQEIYQLSDVYFFPVVEQGNCIDAPLSALEAAACNVPVVATPYGELKELMGCEGFYEIDSFEKDALQGLLCKAVNEEKQPRANVLDYDWDVAVKKLTEILTGGEENEE